jgi:hypothetical protein
MVARLLALGLVACLTFGSFAKAAEPKLPPELQPKRVTLKDDKITLEKALAALEKQTEIKVEKPADTNPELSLNVDRLTFWETLEIIAKQADLRIMYGDEGPALAKVPGGYRELPVSYDGIFRITVKRITALRDLENDNEGCIARLEVAWEPKFRGFLIETGPEELVAKDQRGLALELPPMGKGQTSIDQKKSVELDVRLPAFKRADARIGELKGSFKVIGAGKMLTFTFNKLAKGEKQKQDDVTVELTNFKPDEELWFLDCSVKYPENGPKFESFQSFLVGNEAYLIDKKGRKLDNAGYETGGTNETTSFMNYRFTEDEGKKIALGKPADWKLIYRTPGMIAETPIHFDFKDIPLP